MRSPQSIVTRLAALVCAVAGAFGGCAKGGSAELVPSLAGAAGISTAGGSMSGGFGATGAGAERPGGDTGSAAEGGAAASCGGGETLCSGACVDLQTSPQHCGTCGVACTGDEVCQAGRCECPFTRCGGEASGGEAGSGAGAICVDTSASLVHCGACYAPCRLGETCTDGVCGCQDANLTRCGALCVDVTTDPANCGGCGVNCEGAQVCSQSECRDDCLAPETRCDRPDGTVVCANLQTSLTNCGTCGNACDVGYACNEGSCDCAAGTVLCGDTCVNTRSSLSHCGACDANCTHVCEAGVCVCEGGLLACGDECADVMTNNAHCGACGASCLTGSSCSNGRCECDTGLDPCPEVAGSGCTDLSSDPFNCGACGTDCGPDASCTGGGCQCEAEHLSFCGGECVNLDSDAGHCGDCATACPDGQLCQSGECRTPELIVRSKTPIMTNQVNPSIRLCNQSTGEAVSLSGITIRYWYTVDGTTTNQIPTSPWFQIPATISATRLSPPLPGADFYLTLTIAGDPVLSAGSCVEFQASVHGTDHWLEPYDVTNDHSYRDGDFSVNERITVYQSGNLIWGSAPVAP